MFGDSTVWNFQECPYFFTLSTSAYFSTNYFGREGDANRPAISILSLNTGIGYIPNKSTYTNGYTQLVKCHSLNRIFQVFIHIYSSPGNMPFTFPWFNTPF